MARMASSGNRDWLIGWGETPGPLHLWTGFWLRGNCVRMAVVAARTAEFAELKGTGVVVGPAVDPDRVRSPREDSLHSRIRIEVGALVWGALSIAFLIIGLTKDFPLWALGIALGGPLVLLMLVAKFPLADVPVLFVVLASLGGIGWEFVAADFPPWTVGLIFVVYLLSFEEVLSGLVKVQYLRAVDGLRRDDPRMRRHNEDHLIAKKRIWGYLLATGSSAVIVGGFDSGGHYQGFLALVLLAAFLARSQIFGVILSFFSVTRFVGTAITERRRWLTVGLALVNAGAYALSLHWLITYGSAFGGHISTPWSGPATADADWFGDLETVFFAFLMWLVAAFRTEWTS